MGGWRYEDVGVGLVLVVDELGGHLLPELEVARLRVHKVVVHRTRVRQPRCREGAARRSQTGRRQQQRAGRAGYELGVVVG